MSDCDHKNFSCERTSEGLTIWRKNGGVEFLDEGHLRKVCTSKCGAGHITRQDNGVVTALNPGDIVIHNIKIDFTKIKLNI